MWQMNAADTKARLYVECDLAEGLPLHPAPDQQHYLVNVMRLGDGDAVGLFNGRDGEWRSVLHREGKRGCSLVPERQTRQQHPARPLARFRAGEEGAPGLYRAKSIGNGVQPDLAGAHGPLPGIESQ